MSVTVLSHPGELTGMFRSADVGDKRTELVHRCLRCGLHFVFTWYLELFL